MFSSDLSEFEQEAEKLGQDRGRRGQRGERREARGRCGFEQVVSANLRQRNRRDSTCNEQVIRKCLSLKKLHFSLIRLIYFILLSLFFKSESGGTVLSTNWKEVGEKKIDIQAPDGLEFKKWDK